MTTSRRLTILLVDQDRRVRAALAKLLSATDPQWDVAAVAALSAPLVLTALPVVAVVDVPMVTSSPVLALISELRAATVAVVAISAYDALRGQALGAGARAFLSKDGNTDLIVEAVRAAADDVRLAPARPAAPRRHLDT